MSFPAYPEYKDSGVAWLGEVPSHWDVRRLKRLFELKKRAVHEGDGIVTAFRDGVVTLRSNRRTDGFTNAIHEIGYQGVYVDDLVIHTMDAFAGAIGVSDSSGKATPVYSVCTSRSSHDSPHFFAHLIRHMASSGYISALSKGIRERSTEFRWSEAGEVLLLQPGKEEQLGIVKFLAHETAKIDALIAEQEKLIELLKEKRQAVISYAVTKGLDPNVPMKDSGVEWLGQVPEHWEVMRLRFAVFLNPSKNEILPLDRKKTVSFLPMEVIGNCGAVDSSRTKVIEEVMAGYTYFMDGDVVIAKITPCFENCKGGVMRGLVNGIGFGTTELIVTRPHLDKTTSDYLQWVYASVYFRRLGEAAMYGAGGQKRVPDDFVRNFSIAFPPVAEQSAIDLFLKLETSQADTLLAESQNAIILLKERRSALISAAVTGKIDVRGYAPQQEAV